MAKRKLAESENVTATEPLPVQPEPEPEPPKLVRMTFGLQTTMVSVNGRSYTVVGGVADVDPRDAGHLTALGYRRVD